MFEKVQKLRGAVSRMALVFAVAVVALFSQVRIASATSLIPDVGVDAEQLITDSGLAVGVVMVAAIGLGVAVLVGWKAFRWIRRVSG